MKIIVSLFKHHESETFIRLMRETTTDRFFIEMGVMKDGVPDRTLLCQGQWTLTREVAAKSFSDSVHSVLNQHWQPSA